MSSQYKEAGVDVDAGDSLIRKIRPFIESTFGPQVRGSFGHYGALFSLDALGAAGTLLAAGTDGVGTKLQLTRTTGYWDRIGQDLVAMCGNDILCLGARPLFFLDYFATGKLEIEHAAQVIQGIAEACKIVSCALIGGETAEMPGMYQSGDFDMAGFMVGSVREEKVIDGSRIEVGDTALGLASDGFHANGYTLVRKLIADHQLDLSCAFNEEKETLGDLITRPTRLYGPILDPILDSTSLHGLAHITGGGLLGNLPRILPDQCRIRLDRSRWKRPPLLTYFQELGDISEREMVSVFNDGVGMVLVVATDNAVQIQSQLESSGETVWHLGEIEKRGPNDSAAELVQT